MIAAGPLQSYISVIVYYYCAWLLGHAHCHVIKCFETNKNL